MVNSMTTLTPFFKSFFDIKKLRANFAIAKDPWKNSHVLKITRVNCINPYPFST